MTRGVVVLVTLAGLGVAAYVFRDQLREWSEQAQYRAGRKAGQLIKRKLSEPSTGKPGDALGEPFVQGVTDELAGANAGLTSAVAQLIQSL